MQMIRYKVDGEWTKFMSMDIFIKDHKANQMVAAEILEYLVPADVRDRYQEKFGGHHSVDVNGYCNMGCC